MISTASDFYRVTGADVDASHPHGDLDRIDLDWTGWTNRRAVGSALRGDELAFLMDFAQRRNYMATSGKRLDSGNYAEINPVEISQGDGSTVSSTTWPCSEYSATANFSRLVAPDNFGTGLTGLYGTFSKMVANTTFFPRQTNTNLTKIVSGATPAVVRDALGGITLDTSGLKRAADFEGTNPPILQADVAAYANKIFSVNLDKFGWYLGDGGCGAGGFSVSPGMPKSGATVCSISSVWSSGSSPEGWTTIGSAWGIQYLHYLTDESEWEAEWWTQPPDSAVLLSLVAPHARKVVAACVFVVEDMLLGGTSCLLHTCPMTSKGSGAFELTMKATGYGDALTLASAVGFSTTPQETGHTGLTGYNYHVHCYVYPIVYLDDNVLG